MLNPKNNPFYPEHYLYYINKVRLQPKCYVYDYEIIKWIKTEENNDFDNVSMKLYPLLPQALNLLHSHHLSLHQRIKKIDRYYCRIIACKKGQLHTWIFHVEFKCGISFCRLDPLFES